MLAMPVDVSRERTLLLTPPKLKKKKREHMTCVYKTKRR